MDFKVQTRSELHGLAYWNTVEDAFEHAKKDVSVWKISFSREDERIRFVRVDDHTWRFESLMAEIAKEIPGLSVGP